MENLDPLSPQGLPSAEELAEAVGALVSFPDVAVRISEALEDQSVGAKELGEIVSSDAALTAGLLRMANSPLYGGASEIASVEKAVTVVGLRNLRDITFAICATGTFQGIPNDLVTVENFWAHSLYCATASQELANRSGLCRGQSVFVMGLLHDIGQLVMFNRCPQPAKDALQHALDCSDGLQTYLSERAVFGFDHAAVGAALARLWNFPDVLVRSIGSHHDPFAEGAEPADAELVVHAGNSIALLAELEANDLADAPPIDERAIERIGLDPDVYASIADVARSKAEDIKHLFS